MRAALAALILGGPGPAVADATLLAFSDLDGWAEDDHAAALAAFRETCDLLDGPDWRALCAAAGEARGEDGARSFFEALFRPALVEDGTPALFTAYYEPELAGSRTPTARFRVPLYALPPDEPPAEAPSPTDPAAEERPRRVQGPPEAPPSRPAEAEVAEGPPLPPAVPAAADGPPARPRARGEAEPVPPGSRLSPRRDIQRGALDGRGLEIAWVEDPVEAFFLQVQGSGRIRLPDGGLLRLGYAGANGLPYTSIGQALVARGALADHQLSAEAIRAWARRHPDEVEDLLALNESYVFFREVAEVPPDRGPLGAMGRSVTPLRSVAVDPAHVPLGAPVWVERDGAPLEGDRGRGRLMVAQDTGSAIKGAQRADLFLGTGPVAGMRAGRVRDGGRMVVLLPIQRALALRPETVAPEGEPGSGAAAP